MEFLKLARLRAKTHKVARRAASKHAMRLSLQRFVRNFLMLEQPKLLLQRLGGTYPTPWTRMGELFAPRTGAHYILNFSRCGPQCRDSRCCTDKWPLDVS